jgi:signal recognition particle subunit SRP54
MIPGLPAGLLDGNEEEASDKLKKIVYITDAMTARELDSDGSCFVRRRSRTGDSELLSLFSG